MALLTTSWPRDASDATGRFLANQVERLEASGEVAVEVVAPGRGFRDAGLAGGAGVVANARRRPWAVPLMLVSMVTGLRRAAREADVVHANWLLTVPFAALGAAGRPVVLTLHGSGTAGRFEDLGIAERHPRLFRWLLRRAAVVVCVSPQLEAAARTGGARRTVTIPHGVDVPELAVRERAAGEPTTVLFAGRLSPEKGVDTLVEALAGVDPAAVRLVVAGDGPERTRLEAAGITPLGFVPQERLRELYGEADVLVMPSRREGFGVVALEAMAHGVPVVASRVGGLELLVIDGETGALVEPGDAWALRETVLRLAGNDVLRARLSAASRARAREHYAWPAVTAAMVDVLRRAAR